jgi:hypothetical protein
VLKRASGDLPIPGTDPARVRDLTREILRRAEFRPPRRSLLQAAWHWLTTQLGHLLGQLFGRGGPSGFGWAPVVAVGVIAVIVVGLVGLTIRRTAGGTAGRRRSPVVIVAGRPIRSAEQWLAEAGANEAAGRWRDALRCRYRALVANLAWRGLVEEIPGRTSGEYRYDVARAVPGGAAAFDGATDLFEQAWYGDRPTSQADQAAFDALAADVLDTRESAGRPR